MCTIVPSSYDFIGIVALSVSMSASVSPSLTWSPTLTSHWAITPVSIVGLSFGMVTSIGTSVLPGRTVFSHVGQAFQPDSAGNPAWGSQAGKPDLRCTQMYRTSWTAAMIRLTEGSIDCSSALLYGIGASLEATRRIGASSSSKADWMIRSEIPAPRPQ